MEIVIAEKGAFYFEPAITAEEARGRASAHKASAFGTLSRLFSRPKDDDITISDLGIWYLPLWHAKAHLRFAYDRNDSYKVPVKTPHARAVNLAGTEYAVTSGAVEIAVVEHCERDEQKELWLDALRNEPANAQPYLKAGATAVNLDEFAPEGAKIVAPTVRAAAVVRTLLGDDFRPADADAFHEETVNVECLDLYLRPTYNFTCSWPAKNKSTDIAVDAVTGEIQTQASATMALVAKLTKPETLFDIGAETLNLVVPGGAIPLRIMQAIAEKRKT